MLSLAALQRKGLVTAPRPPIYYEEGVTPEFSTPSKKIEFYSVQLREKGFDPVPKYRRPEAGPPGSFRLLFGRSPVHTFSRTQTNPVLAQAMSENEVWVNAESPRERDSGRATACGSGTRTGSSRTRSG